MTTTITKALLIGDEAASVESIGLQIIQARTLEEASLLLRKRHVDVILVNLKCSDVDQIEAIRNLYEQMESIPIVVLSDSAESEFVLQAIRHGAQDVMPLAGLSLDVLGRAVRTSIERKRLEQHRILHSREDELTGLANRCLLEERFERAMARADRQATLLALVAIELDQPKPLLERHGHDCFDRLMPLIGERLTTEIRETDTLARTRDVGFTWLVEGLSAINDISALVDRLPRVLADPFDLDYREVRVTVSVGVAICPFHGRNFSTLLKMAEAAMLDVSILNGDGLLMPPLPSMIKESRSTSLV